MTGTDPQRELAALGTDVAWPDQIAAARARERLGADSRYGRLAELAEWLAGVLGNAAPPDLTRVRNVSFGSVAGRDPATPDIGGLLGIGQRIVALPPDEPTAAEPAVGPAAAEAATTDAVDAEALPRAAAARAVARGAAAADREVDTGVELLIASVPAPDVRATTIVSVLTATEPVKVLARGVDATDPDAWMARAIAVRDARRRGFAHRDDPMALLAVIGSAELAAAAGFVLQAAVRRTPVLLDGLAATVAALLAYTAQPRAVRWWQAAGSSPGPAQELALAQLGLQPVLDLRLGLADGTAGALAVPVLRAAICALRCREE